MIPYIKLKDNLWSINIVVRIPGHITRDDIEKWSKTLIQQLKYVSTRKAIIYIKQLKLDEKVSLD